jgi:hypothetical protein
MGFGFHGGIFERINRNICINALLDLHVFEKGSITLE